MNSYLLFREYLLDALDPLYSVCGEYYGDSDYLLSCKICPECRDVHQQLND